MKWEDMDRSDIRAMDETEIRMLLAEIVNAAGIRVRRRVMPDCGPEYEAFIPSTVE